MDITKIDAGGRDLTMLNGKIARDIRSCECIIGEVKYDGPVNVKGFRDGSCNNCGTTYSTNDQLRIRTSS